jgi:PAS domain S-box-containing protein
MNDKNMNRDQTVLQALSDCAQAFLQTRDFRQAAYTVYDTCKKFIGADTGYVALLSSDETLNELLFLDMGTLPCTLDPDLPMPIRGLLARAYSTGKAVYENNFQQSEWQQYLPEGHGRLENVLFAPLINDDKAVGLFGFANKPGGFNDDDVLVIKAFVDLAAMGLMKNRTLENLEKSVKHFSALMLTANDAIITVDQEGKIHYWNHAAEKCFGYSAKEIIGKPCTCIIPEKYAAAHREGFARVVQTGISGLAGRQIEVEGLMKNGDTVPVELSISKWEADDAVFVTGIVRDITGRKRMESALLESEDLFRSIFETSPDPVNLNRLEDGKFVLVNKKFLELTGFERTEVIGRTAVEIQIWNDLRKRDQFFSQLLEQRQINAFEAEFRRRDGKILTALISAKLLSYQGKQHVLAVNHDITELKNAERELVAAHAALEKRYEVSTEKLKESEVKYSALVEALLTGVYMCEDEKIVFVNKQFVDMFGYERDEILAMNITDLISPEDKDYLWSMCEITAPGDTVEGGYEIRGVRKNGDIIYLLGRSTVIEFNGRRAVLGNVADISKRKVAEKKRQKSEEDLRLLSAQLFSTEERERKRIARDIHDSLGQALSAIKFSVESSLLLINAHSFSSARQALEKIIPLTRQSIDEVRRIISDLRPSTLDDLGLVATISWFCREFESIFTGIHIDKDIRVEEEDIPKSLKTVIYRILQEALNNAAKHSNAESVHLQLAKIDTNLELVVEDKGVGFDVDAVTARNGARRGMGLASMKERTLLSGGIINIVSVPGEGTRVHIFWPLKAPAAGHVPTGDRRNPGNTDRRNPDNTPTE